MYSTSIRVSCVEDLPFILARALVVVFTLLDAVVLSMTAI